VLAVDDGAARPAAVAVRSEGAAGLVLVHPEALVEPARALAPLLRREEVPAPLPDGPPERVVRDHQAVGVAAQVVPLELERRVVDKPHRLGQSGQRRALARREHVREHERARHLLNVDPLDGLARRAGVLHDIRRRLPHWTLAVLARLARQLLESVAGDEATLLRLVLRLHRMRARATQGDEAAEARR